MIYSNLVDIRDLTLARIRRLRNEKKLSQAEAAARANHQRNQAKQKHPPLLLRGLLYCGYCGIKYRSSTNRAQRGYINSGGLQRYYFHPMPTFCQVAQKSISAWMIEKQFWGYLGFLNQLPESDKDDIAQLIVTPAPSRAPRDVSQRRERLEQRLRGFEQMRADGDITREKFHEYKNEIEAELRELAPPPESSASIILTYDDARAVLDDLTTVLRDSSALMPEHLNMLMRLIIERIPVYGDTIGKPQLREVFKILEPEQ